MRSNTFNYSLLAIGVAAVLGLSTAANAETPNTGETATGVEITNQATASYKVAEQLQPTAKSNIVKVIVSQQVSFTLSADNNDTAEPTKGTQFDEKNENEEVAPNGFVVFRHTLTNTGNLTDNYTINLTSTDPQYDTSKSTVSYKIYNAAGTEDTDRTREKVAYDTANGKSFPLEKGHYIEFSINAKTNGNKGNDKQTLQITAVSEELTKPGSTAIIKQLTNTNSSFTKLPTFSIVKTVLNGLDLKNTADTAKYQIVVTNDGTDFNTDATDITITDVLPVGLEMAETLTTGTNIAITGGATKGNIVGGAIGSESFTVQNVNIPIGQSITITFTVKQGGTKGNLDTVNAQNTINHVTVTDDLDDDVNTPDNTLIDSTNSTIENVGLFYPTNDTDFTNGTEPTIAGDDSTMPLVTIKRDLTLTGGTLKEIAPTTELTVSETAGQVTYEAVITNTGKDVDGSKPGELKFTIKDGDGTVSNKINIVPNSVTVTYDPKDGTPVQGPLAISAGTGGIYDINSVLPTGVKVGGTITIKYNVSADEAPMFTPIDSTDDANATIEETFVTLIPGEEGASASVSVTDTTKVRGLTLVKKQAIDATCEGTPAAADFVTTTIGGLKSPIQVLPGQCIVYQIEAKNTSTAALGFNITNITISDEISPKAEYVASSLTTTKGTPTVASSNVSAVNFDLATQETATMQFKVKIKTAN